MTGCSCLYQAKSWHFQVLTCSQLTFSFKVFSLWWSRLFHPQGCFHSLPFTTTTYITPTSRATFWHSYGIVGLQLHQGATHQAQDTWGAPSPSPARGHTHWLSSTCYKEKAFLYLHNCCFCRPAWHKLHPNLSKFQKPYRIHTASLRTYCWPYQNSWEFVSFFKIKQNFPALSQCSASIIETYPAQRF